MSLRRCQAVQQEQCVLWSAGSPGCCLIHGGKLAGRSSQLLFTAYLGCTIQPPGVQKTLQQVSALAETWWRLSRCLWSILFRLRFVKKRKGLKSVSSNGESVWGKYSVLMMEKNCCLKPVEVPLHVSLCLNNLFWIHMPWVWIDLIVFQAAWNQQKDNTNRRMAPPEGSKTSIKLHTEKPYC